MRIIKFRGWSKSKKIMIEDLNGWSKGYENEYELMQFTGLLDKQGKEIYEGDIIKIRDTICTIRYEESTASYHLIFRGGTSYQYEKYRFDKESTSLNVLGFFEVIGNIYENPELFNERG